MGLSKKAWGQILIWGSIATVAGSAVLYSALLHSLSINRPTSLLACMDTEAHWYAWTCEQVLRHTSFTPAQVNEFNANAGARFAIAMNDPVKAEEMLSLLLARGVDINAGDEKTEGWTALHGAVAGREVNNVELLLKYGARPDSREKNGLTPLDFARRIQRKYSSDPATAEVVRMLEAGAQHAASPSYRTPPQ